MPLSIDEYRNKLVNKVLLASSEDDVKRFCDTAIKSLEQNNVNGHIIIRFVDKLITDFESFNPRSKNVRQWINIQTAGRHFNEIKQRRCATA
ncbi:MAG: hypothetical protein HYZ15_13600 [Sphingobacteriales bacterium]|nr:hypothetical protein [Sphingobacteriales bacterium]